MKGVLMTAQVLYSKLKILSKANSFFEMPETNEK